MGYGKVSVTPEEEVLTELRQTVGPRELSAFVNEAIRRRLQAVRLKKLLAEMEEEAGPIPPEVQRQVDELEWPA